MDPEREQALKAIDVWVATWGSPHLDLACHAAFPLALTPDLLYHIWANFRRDVNGNPLTIPWEAVPDLLLSSLCRESGPERYRMEAAVREELLQRLAADGRFGLPRIQELADFLRAYVAGQRLRGNRYEQQQAETEALAALAYTEPETMVDAVADAYESGGLERSHLIRLSRLLQTFHGPLTTWVDVSPDVQAQFEQLWQYGESMGRWARGDREGAAENLRELAGSSGRVRIARRSVPLPQEVAEREGKRLTFTYRVTLPSPGSLSFSYSDEAGGGGGTGTLTWEREAEPALFRQIEAAARGRLDPEAGLQLGVALFERLVPEPERFHKVYEEAQAAGADLRFLLEIEPRRWPEAATTPWELLALPAGIAGERPLALATAPHFSVVRTAPHPTPMTMPTRDADEPLRVALVTGSLRRQESALAYRHLFEAALARHGERVALTVLEGATAQQLAGLLREADPHALHLVAEMEEAMPAPRLALQDEDGRQPHWLDASMLASILDPWRHFLFLQPAIPGPTAAHLAGLLGESVPAVATVQLPIRDEEWQPFLYQFYRGSLHELPAGSVFQTARRAAGTGNRARLAAAAPVLYTSLADSALFPRAPEEPAETEVEAEAKAETVPAFPPFDFSAWIDGHTRDFRNREEALMAVAQWLADPRAPRLFLVTGEPRSGKTAFAARLAQISTGEVASPPVDPGLYPGFVSALHFCAARRPEWQDPLLFVQSLAAQLAQSVPDFDKALGAGRVEQKQMVPESIARADDIRAEIEQRATGMTAEQAFFELILDPLSLLEPRAPLLILIDGLDEALEQQQRPTIVDLLGMMVKAPRTVRLLATTRAAEEVLAALADFQAQTYALEAVETTASPPEQALDDQQVLAESQVMLEELLQHVEDLEGSFAEVDAQPMGPGGEALLGLRETDMRIGNPSNRLTRLTPELFARANVTPDPIQEQMLQADFDYYCLSLAVLLAPKRGAQFQMMECHLEFPEETAIVQTIFPEARWRSLIQWGGSARIGLNSNLEWEVGLSGSQLQEVTGSGMVPEANLKTENEMSSFITVPNYSFDIGQPEITATGVGDTQASWRLQNPDLQEGKQVEFLLVFKVPAGTEQVELAVSLLAEPKFSWLTAQLADVFGELGDRLKSIFTGGDQKREGAERLPIGVHEKFTLSLPNPWTEP